MLAAILVAVLGVSAPEGTLFTTDGGRVRGVLVEAGPAGVTVRLPDGSTRRYAPSDVRKVVLSDGSLWRPGDPPPPAPGEEPPQPPAPPLPPAAEVVPAPPVEAAPPPAPDPAAAAAEAGPATPAAAPEPPAPPPGPMIIPVERLDTVFLASGGRVRAFVTEETPQAVVVRMVDGTERRYPAEQVAKIAYADGSASSPGAPRK
jgi:hypothetical protein